MAIRIDTFRRKKNLMLALASEAFTPLIRPAMSAWAGSRGSDSKDWRTILLLGMDHHLGDILYNTGSLGELRKGFPNAKICYACPTSSAVILKNNPFVDHVFCADSSKDFFSQHSQVGKEIRSASIDCAINYGVGSPFTEVHFWIKHRIPNRVGRIHKGFSGAVTHSIEFNDLKAYPFYFQDLVRQLTGSLGEWSVRPIIYPDHEDLETGDRMRQECVFSSIETTVPCFITSRQKKGVYPPEKYGELLRWLKGNSSARIVLCGASGDLTLLNRINTEYGLKARVMAGCMNVRALSCFLKGFPFVISTDSGPRHIANAAGAPVVFFRNIGARASESGKYLDSEVDLAGPSECVPEERERSVWSGLNTGQLGSRILETWERLK